MAADAPAPRVRAGGGARHDLPDLLQVRGGQPGGQPQAEHVGAAGLLQPRGGRRAARDRDRRGPVGLGAGLRLRAVRPRVQGLHGARLLRPEAVPSLDDPHLGRRGRAEPVAGHERRARDPGGRPRQHGQPGHRHQRGGRGRGDPRGHALRARERPQPRPDAPDRRGPGGARAARRRGRRARRHRGVRRRRLELRRAGVPVHPGRRGRPRDPHRRRRAGRLPHPHARPLRLRLRRHGQDGAAAADAHPGARVRAARDPLGGPPVPRHGPARLAHGPHGDRRGARLPPERVLRRGRPLRPRRGHHPRAGAVPRPARGGRGGRARPPGGGRAHDPLQPLRPRELRHGGVRRVPERRDGRTPSCPRTSSTRRPPSSRGCRRSRPDRPGRPGLDRGRLRRGPGRARMRG